MPLGLVQQRRLLPAKPMTVCVYLAFTQHRGRVPRQENAVTGRQFLFHALRQDYVNT